MATLTPLVCLSPRTGKGIRNGGIGKVPVLVFTGDRKSDVGESIVSQENVH